MSKGTYLLKLPTSVKTAAARLAKRRAYRGINSSRPPSPKGGWLWRPPASSWSGPTGDAKPKDLLKYLRKAGCEQRVEFDRRQGQQDIRDPLPAGGEPSMART
jgi:hypothetical protein